MRNLLIITVSLFAIFSTASAESKSTPVEKTARVIFTVNEGEYMAQIIPTHENGSFPRSGWIECSVPASLEPKIAKILQGKEQAEGYYRATYLVLGKKRSPIRTYLGKLTSLTPWQPSGR